MGKKIVITGSSGFVGSNLLKYLKTFDYEITEIDVKNGWDITNWESMKQINPFDIVIHLAALVFVPDSYVSPREFYYNNVVSTLNMLELCRINKAKMIFASSYVYGNPQYLPIDEKHPLVSFNPYCQSKIIGEKLCESYNEDFGVPVIIFRPFNIYGTGQNINFLIPLIQKQMTNSGKIELKDPRPKRDFVHVKDVVDAYQKAIEYNFSSYEIFNIGSGTSYSVKEIADIVAMNSKKKIPIIFSNERRENEVLDTVADITKIKAYLNWEPKISFQEGIRQI